MDERFTPQMAVAYAAKRRGVAVEAFGVAPVAVLSWHRRTAQSLAEATAARLPEHWFYGEQYPLYSGEVGGHRVCFVHVPVGAPGTVMVMEELIACGARAFLGLGLAGSLQPHAPVGTWLIPTSCVREEGTSGHYVSADVPIGPSARLVQAVAAASRAEGVEPLTGPLWTTDAPYRELKSKVETYRQQGVLGVDMETSAVYALGQFRGVDACNLLVVSDELWDEWRPAFGQPELREAMRRAERAILRCLSGDLGA